MKNTPGPWHWVDDDTDEPWDGKSPHASLRTVEEFGENVNDGERFEFRLPKFIIGYAEDFSSVDDANVIAAAPGQQAKIDVLLAACIATLEAIDTPSSWQKTELRKVICAAIAKAEG